MNSKWPIVRLDSLFSFIGGGTPARSNPLFYSGNIPWITVKDMRGDIIDSSELKITSEAISSSATNLIPARTVVFATRVGLGKVGVLSVDAAINQDLKAAVPRRNDIVPNYFLYWMKSNADVMVNAGVGATVKGVTLEFIRSLSLPLPSVDEQKRIVQVVSHVATQIELRKKQIAKLDLLAKSRFIEMFGDPVKNPNGWPVLPISSFAKVRIGPFGSSLHAEDYVSEGYPLVNPSHIIEEKIVPDVALTLSEKKYRELSAYHLEPGDIVLGRRGEIGRCALVTQAGLFCGTGSMFVRIMKDCRPDFLQRVISHPTYKAVLEDKAVGVTMKNLNAGMIENSLVALPPISLQNEFASFIEELDKSKFTIRKSLEELETLYRALLQEYFG